MNVFKRGAKEKPDDEGEKPFDFTDDWEVALYECQFNWLRWNFSIKNWVTVSSRPSKVDHKLTKNQQEDKPFEEAFS